MALSDRQIERYSRQIIVPGIGGRGQERLLAATLAIAGELADLQTPLAYLVGAGVGTIFVEPAGGSPIDSRLIDDLRALNPDSRVTAGSEAAGEVDLVILLIGSAASLEVARRAVDRFARPFVMLARLDASPRIAIFAGSPCPRCAEVDLLGRFGSRADNADFVSMLATAEAIRLLTRDERAAALLIEFDGYQSRTVDLRRRPSAAPCRCESGFSADG